jgi:hypothetical protein
VTLVYDEGHRPPRAAGFIFDEIGEIDLHARLILSWLAGNRETAGGHAAGQA